MFFILSVIILLIAVFSLFMQEGFGAGVCLVLGLALMLAGSISVVPTRNVGIVTSWGKPTGRETGAGLQLTAPWQGIDHWDARRQTFDHGTETTCVQVRIAGQRDACVEVRIEWSSQRDSASDNWALYGKTIEGHDRFETFAARRVEPQMTTAINGVFARFDPLSLVDPKTGDAPAPNLNALYRAPTVAAINAAIGTDVKVDGITYGFIHYDNATTDALAAYGQKILEGRNLAVDEVNAVAKQRITAKNAAVNPVTRCLEIADSHGREPGLCLGASLNLTREVTSK